MALPILRTRFVNPALPVHRCGESVAKAIMLIGTKTSPIPTP